jgi:putative ABC transport system permease protein
MLSVLKIASANLLSEKGRLVITAGGVAFSVMLILILLGLYQGWNLQITRFLGGIETDFWIGQKGVRDMSHTVSILPASLEDSLKQIEGVDQVIPFVGRNVSFELDGKEAHLYLVGTDNNSPIQPYKVIEGKNNPSSGEIVLDKVFADDRSLKIGDTLAIRDRSFEIVGISSGGYLLVYSYAFVPLSDLRSLLDFTQFSNYYLVQSSNPETTRKALEKAYPDLTILSKQEFLNNNQGIVKESFLPIISVLLVISFIIGIAVIGLTIFTATIEKGREYGVLKALGFSDRQLFGIGLVQAVLSGIIGLAIGLVLTPLIAAFASANVGGFLYDLEPVDMAKVGGVTLLMSALASLAPLKRLLSIDPAQVFKA